MFKDVFKNKQYSEELAKSLDEDDLWFRIGESIFPKDTQEWNKLNDLKDVNIATGIKAFNLLQVEITLTYNQSIQWVEFKQLIISLFNFDYLTTLGFNDEMFITQMETTQIEILARKLASVQGEWWDSLIDHFVKKPPKRMLIKMEISSFREIEIRTSRTTKLTNLVCESCPEYTMEQFSIACKKIHRFV